MPSNELMYREVDGTPRMVSELFPLPMAATPSSGLTAFDHGALTVDATAGGVAIPDLADAVRAVLTLETAQVRYTYDGTAPTAAVGHLVEIGDVLIVEGAAALAAFRAFRTGSTSGVFHYTLEH